MGFFRIFPTRDTWITDGHRLNNVLTRGTGSSHGRSPSLNVFARKDDMFTGSIELARTLIQFDTTELSGKVFDEQTIPLTGTEYTLKMFNMLHDSTVPSSYDLFVYPLSRSWDEGSGIDDDNHKDFGFANWLSASSTATWVVTGSDFINTSSFGSGAQHFDRADEGLDLEMNVTKVVYSWLSGVVGDPGGLTNNGIVLKLGATEETNLSNSYYRKAFHGRESKFVDRIPYIEARWDDVIKDNRSNFAYDNDSNLFLYNFVRGELTDLSTPVIVRIRDHLLAKSSSFSQELTATFVSTGIYSASFNIELTSTFSSSWSDTWFSGARAFMTGAFTPLILTSSQGDQYDQFTIDVTNLQRVYRENEEARIKVNVRKRNFVTHLGTIASASLKVEREFIEKMYFRIDNDLTGETVVPFGTGSVPHTQLSYDKEGNYFNLFFKSFVPGFTYRILFLVDINQFDKKVIDGDFVFKVTDGTG